MSPKIPLRKPRTLRSLEARRVSEGIKPQRLPSECKSALRRYLATPYVVLREPAAVAVARFLMPLLPMAVIRATGHNNTKWQVKPFLGLRCSLRFVDVIIQPLAVE